ncbi:MAG: DNA recombination protein RmuC [Candidatus Binatia bacterium]
MLEDLVLAALVVSSVSTLLTIILLVLVLRTPAVDPGALEKALRDELRLGREEAAHAARELREESAAAAAASRQEVARAVSGVREGIEQRLRDLQASNENKLDQMRRTVDEKLHETLEKRLGESFRTVSSQLDAVHKGLGQMQALASGVGDLKKVLTNVKVRGTWGEVQLGALLEQVLTPEQFDRNVATRKGSREVVEFAVRLPGSGDGEVVHLPIDSKFPHEDYARLVEASEAGDSEAVQRATADLVRAVKKSAQDIRDKYLDPPSTTDFALMFLPTEGLYAEILRQGGLSEELQQRYRVVVVGPTTLAATLSSLRMGFRTLAIEKGASEVWRVLSAVKTEFGKFGGMLDRARTQLATATKTLEGAGVRTRQMERRLRGVETLSEGESRSVLGLDFDTDDVAGMVADEEEVRDSEDDASTGGG